MITKINNWFAKNRQDFYITSLVLLMLFIVCIPAIFVVIGPGYEGVKWLRFFNGTNLQESYPEGTRVKWPWDRIYLYNMRLQQTTKSYSALTNNGVSIAVDVSFRYRPNPENLPKLHKYVGEDYINVLVIPKIGSHIREIIANYSPEQLYSGERVKIEQELFLNVRNDLTHIRVGSQVPSEALRLMQFVVFENIYISAIHLPERVKEAIEAKEAIKQKALSYVHQLEIARQEKIRKKIEAEGVRDFQNTINQGISDKYLRWKGIEATLELAQSDNSKVVVIGSGKDGLPIILGSDYMQNSQPQGANPTGNSPASVDPSTATIQQLSLLQQQQQKAQKQADKNMKVVNNTHEKQ